MTHPLQHSLSTGCMTSRSCGRFWLRIQTLSSAPSRRTPSTGGRRASRVVTETRHLCCWSHCLSVEVDFLSYLNQMLFSVEGSLIAFELKSYS